VWHARVVGALALLAVGIAVVAVSRGLPYHSDYGPGPGFLPTWAGYVLAACAAIVTVKELRAPRSDEHFFRPRTRLAVKVLVAIAVAFLLVPLLGLAIPLALFVGAAMRMMGKHRWVTCGAVAVASALGIHQVFGRWLDIPLPTGLVGW
jgi:hypothetical protein